MKTNPGHCSDLDRSEQLRKLLRILSHDKFTTTRQLQKATGLQSISTWISALRWNLKKTGGNIQSKYLGMFKKSRIFGYKII